MDVIGPLAQKVEHLRKGQGHKKVIGGRGVGNSEENRRFPIPDFIQLQLVIGHNLPKLGDVKGSQTGAAGNQNAFCSFARNELSRTF